MKTNRKGVNFFAVSVVFSIVAILIFVSLILLSEVLNAKFEKVQQSIETANSCEHASNIIKDVSNELSEKAYFFVMTHNPVYMEEYVNEKFNTKQREQAEEKIESLSNVPESTLMRLKVALNQASSLGYIELYAMKLISLSLDYDNIPSQVKNQFIKKEHRSLTRAEQQEVAQQFIFDQGYLDAKKRVNNNCTNIIDEIETNVKVRLNNESRSLRRHLLVLDITIGILFIFSTIFSLCIWNLVLRPLGSHVHSIKNKESLKVIGSRELRYLAETYNEVHEYDALTKIYNRRAFDEICNKSQEAKNSIGLLLVDLDNFKTINDTYGHVNGDYVLQAVASLLSTFLKAEGDIARIGGDEFAVVLSSYSVITPDFMTNRIELINKELRDLHEVKNCSISAGLAYSTKGYSRELYENADKALYFIKEHGKSGLHVWNEIL